jgi:diacylglycerol O-acyltransferase
MTRREDGALERLSAMDAALLGVETPTNLMVITGVMILGAPIDFDELRAVVENRLVPIRRFRQRIVPAEGLWTTPCWQDDPDFDLDDHLHRVALPLPAGHNSSLPDAELAEQAALQDLVGELASTPLDRSGPLWAFHLIEGYGQGCALVCRIHHSIGDGVSLVQVLLSITDGDPGAAPVDPAPGEAPRGSQGTSWSRPGRRRRAIRRTRRIAHRLAHKAVRTGVSLAAEPSRVYTLVNTGREAVTALGDIVLAPPDSQTAFKGKLGIPKRVAWSGPMPLDDVKVVGRYLCGTVNDVMLAAVAGALRRYLQGCGQTAEEIGLHAAVPVNLRPRGGEGGLGNRVGTVFLPLPIGVEDPIGRLQAIKRSMDRLKDSLQAPATYAVIRGMSLVPPDLQRSLVGILAQQATAIVTNVAGPREPRYLAGAPLEAVLAWVPKTGGLALGVSILSYAGQVRLGVITDRGLVPDPETILAGFQAEFEELLALARDAPAKPTIQDLIAALDDALAVLEAMGGDGNAS